MIVLFHNKLCCLVTLQHSDLIMIFLHRINALCIYPHVKVPIRDLNQTFTTALIFQQSHYFRQKYLEIREASPLQNG